MAERRYIDPAPWDEDGKFWDSIELAGKEWPGVATVDITRANKWDTKKAKGTHGADRTYNGADLAKVKIQIQCWNTEQIKGMWEECLPLVEPVPGKEKIDAVALSHPVAIIRNVSQITIDSVSGPKIQDRMAVFDIDATEYRPPIAKNATGTANGGGVKGNANCDNLRKYLYELYAKQNELKAEQSSYIFGLAAGQYESDEQKADWQTKAQGLEGARVAVAVMANNTIVQMDALKCYAQPPSATTATTDP